MAVKVTSGLHDSKRRAYSGANFPENPAMRRFLPDQFTLILIATVAFASFFPAVGKGASFMMVASNVAISLLFFLHGARPVSYTHLTLPTNREV